MSSQKKPLPQKSHIEEAEQLKLWGQKYGSQLLTAVLVVLIGLTVMGTLRTRMNNRIVEASERLSAATSAVELQAIVSDFPKTPSAPMALLALAKLHYDQGNYEQARFQYERFSTEYADHDMAPAARLGRAFSTEALGDPISLREAANAFSDFAQQFPNHFLTPQAIFGHARCLEQLDEIQEAITLYEDFIVQHPESYWSIRAEELLAAAQRQSRRRATTIIQDVDVEQQEDTSEQDQDSDQDQSGEG